MVQQTLFNILIILFLFLGNWGYAYVAKYIICILSIKLIFYNIGIPHNSFFRTILLLYQIILFFPFNEITMEKEKWIIITISLIVINTFLLFRTFILFNKRIISDILKIKNEINLSHKFIYSLNSNIETMTHYLGCYFYYSTLKQIDFSLRIRDSIINTKFNKHNPSLEIVEDNIGISEIPEIPDFTNLTEQNIYEMGYHLFKSNNYVYLYKLSPLAISESRNSMFIHFRNDWAIDKNIYNYNGYILILYLNSVFFIEYKTSRFIKYFLLNYYLKKYGFGHLYYSSISSYIGLRDDRYQIFYNPNGYKVV